MNAKKENGKNEDIEFHIRQFIGKGEEKKRSPMNISVDYLSYLIIKTDNSLQKVNIPEEELDPNSEFLFGIRKISKDNSYKIINSLKISNQTEKTKEEIQNLRKKLWYLVNSGEDKDKINEDYILNENDIIRLGDCFFEVIRKKVKKIDNSSNNNSNNKDQLYDISDLNNKFGPVFKFDKDKGEKTEQNNQNNQSNQSNINNINNINNKNNSTIKKDNLEDSNINENPIIKLCDCYNHFNCIKEQLFSKLEIEQKLDKEKVISFNLDEFKCNVCGKNLPLRFEKSGKIYNFLEFDKMDYIVLEYLGKSFIQSSNENTGEKKNENEELKKVYIIKLENGILKIGRNNKDNINDIVIPDLTISRNHAVLKFNKENGNLILENKNEKNAEKTSTFVLIKDNFTLKREKIKFLTGKCYITINLKDKDNKK